MHNKKKGQKTLRNYNRPQKSFILKEDITAKEFGPMLKSFVSFASDKLGLLSPPNIKIKDDDVPSFAHYSPHSNTTTIHTKNRHPMDIFRSLAHELCHQKQKEDGRLGKNIEMEGSTGSDIENEANATAGKIMRWFAQANPHYFKYSHVTEEILNEMEEDLDAKFKQFMTEEGNVPSTPSQREWGKTSLKNIYRRDTPGEGKKPKVKKKLIKKVSQEEVLDGVGTGPTTGDHKAVGYYRMAYPPAPMAESVEKWKNNPKTVSQFRKRYGNNADIRLNEAAERLKASNPVSVAKIKEKFRKR